MNRNLTATLLIIVAIGLYFTVTKSVVAESKELLAKNQQYVEKIKTADELIKQLAAMKQQYDGIDENLRKELDFMVPSTVDNIRLIIDLTNIAQKNGMILSSVKADVPSKNSGQSYGSRVARPDTSMVIPGLPPANPSQTESEVISLDVVSSEPSLDKVLVSFNTNTSYEKFLSFLQDIEKNLRIMELARLSVKARDDNTFDFEVELQTYWLRQ